MNPLIVYLYNNPLGYRCIQKYANKNLKEANVCNPYVARKFWNSNDDDNILEGLIRFLIFLLDTLEGDQAFLYLSIEQWGQYFESIGHIKNSEAWV